MLAESVTGAAGSWEQRGRLATVFAVMMACVVGFASYAPNALALSPSVSSKAASKVDYSTATFNGTVNPNGLETKTYFEYGPTTSYGSKTAEGSVGSGSSSLETSNAVTGLTANTTYHYRVVATNADGTSTGGDRTFNVGWKLEPLAETGTQMLDVSCASPTMCIALRDRSPLRWNGSEWTTQTLAVPPGGKKVGADAVSCPSVSACVVVGSYENASSELKTLAEAWNGSEWKVQTSPTPASFWNFLDVSCLTASECTAVGSSGSHASALRWNGTEWSLQTTVNSGTQSYLMGVSCISSTFCMAAGFYSEKSEYIPLAERWNGTEWTLKAPVKPSGTTRSWLYDVSCVSSSACWAVGMKEVVPATNETMVQFWNGSSWSLQSSPNPEGGERNLESVSCTSQSFCMAVGYTTNEGSKPFGLKYDGSSWTLQNMPMPAGATRARPFAVSCIASRGCQSVGQYWNAVSTIFPLAEDTWRAAAPTVTTTAATSVGEKTATVNGTANPNGSETKVYFEYGTTTLYGSKTAEVNIGSGTGSVEQKAALTGLKPATLYHYRIVASNENPETSRGSDLTFTTTSPPTVSTSAAEVDNTTGEAATLKGQVNPNGSSTAYQFEYGTSPGVYTNTVPAIAESAGSGTESKAVSYKVTGLTRGKTYYYRITATNAVGKADGNQVSFTTPDLPGVTTEPASGLKRKCATLQGTVQTNGQGGLYWFEYGATTSYGTKTSMKFYTSEPASKSLKESICGLTAGSVYHYRLVAQNGLGTTNGSDQSFTTLSAVTLKVGGSPLSFGSSLKVSSSNFTLKTNTGFTQSCAETEFNGTVAENPGAVESVTAPKMQNTGGTKCPYLSPYTMHYTFTEVFGLEFMRTEGGEGIVTTGKFPVIGWLYLGGFKSTECKYTAELSGTYKLSSPLSLELTGVSELTNAGFNCYGVANLSGTFTVTSGGVAVEATP